MVAGDANDAFTREVVRFVQSLDKVSPDPSVERPRADTVQP
jgi:hypothetical protein